MIALYFLLDIVFYNYTSCKTMIFLLAILEPEKNKYFPVLIAILFDYLLNLQGKFFLLFSILYLLYKYRKIIQNTLLKRLIAFFILLIICNLLAFLLYHKWLGNLSGILTTLFFLIFSYKKKSTS